MSSKFRDYSYIYEDMSELNYLRANCDKLDQLNKILQEIIPKHLVKHCHFGAIDIDKNILVLFISTQEAFIVLRHFSGVILDKLSENGYLFDGLLTKIANYPRSLMLEHEKKETEEIKDEVKREKLRRLAELVGKPELVP